MIESNGHVIEEAVGAMRTYGHERRRRGEKREKVWRNAHPPPWSGDDG